MPLRFQDLVCHCLGSNSIASMPEAAWGARDWSQLDMAGNLSSMPFGKYRPYWAFFVALGQK